MRQRNLFREEAGEREDVLLVWVKQVRERRIELRRVSSSNVKSKLLNIIESLLEHGSVKELGELGGLNENCREWIEKILSSSSLAADESYDEVKYLLRDFTDAMKTSMRMEEKYAIAILSENGLFLAHSEFGERTVTPQLNVVERMLDRDNIIRFVNFSRQNETIRVTYHERSYSKSFTNWLGISEEGASYFFGGPYKFNGEIHGFKISVELTEEDIESILNNQKPLKLEREKLIFETPVKEIYIKEVRLKNGRKTELSRVIENIKAQKYNIHRYREEYGRLNSTLLPQMYRYYEDEEKVVHIANGREIIDVRKDTHQNFYVLFVNEKIEMRNSFLEKLYAKFVNNEELRICHVGAEFNPTPFKFNSMEIYNHLNTDSLLDSILDYYHRTNLQDTILKRMFEIIILELLKKTNSDNPIYYFLEKFVEKVKRSLSPSVLTKIEDLVIEFKSRDYFTGNDSKIVDQLTEDMISKLNKTSFKVYFIGVEDNGELDPVPRSRINQDRLENIRKNIVSRLKSRNFDVELFPVLIPVENANQKGYIISFIVKKESV